MDVSVVDLAFEHERSYYRRSGGRLSIEAIGRLIALFVRLRFVRAALSRRLDRDAKFFSDQAVWFRGAAKEVDDGDRSVPIDPDFRLVNSLRGVEDDVTERREWLLSMVDDDPRLTHRLRALAASYASYFEAVRELRGAVQAYEADRCAVTRKNSSAIANQTRESLDATLRDIVQGE